MTENAESTEPNEYTNKAALWVAGTVASEVSPALIFAMTEKEKTNLVDELIQISQNHIINALGVEEDAAREIAVKGVDIALQCVLAN